jgi:hypothetical protein
MVDIPGAIGRDLLHPTVIHAARGSATACIRIGARAESGYALAIRALSTAAMMQMPKQDPRHSQQEAPMRADVTCLSAGAPGLSPEIDA